MYSNILYVVAYIVLLYLYLLYFHCYIPNNKNGAWYIEGVQIV